MGLGTTHGAWRGPYSSFNMWRNAVATAAGYAVYKVVDDAGHLRPTVMIDWGHVTSDQLRGYWGETPDDPLIVLIAHSDCEGVIMPEQATPLADRLEELLPLLDAERRGPIESDAEITRRFIDGLRSAASEDEPVEFR